MYPYGQTPQEIQEQISKMLMPQQQQQASIHTVKVNGRAGAEAYNMPPNSDTILLDMNESIIWFVMTDGAGYKTVVPYDFHPHKEVSQQDTIKSLEDRITKLEEAVRNGKPDFRPNNQKPAKPGNGNNDAGSRSNA